MQKITLAYYNAFVLVMACLLSGLYACTPAPTAMPTLLPSTDTFTPSPTNTFTPTATTPPTATSTPTPTPTPLLAGLGQVVFSESFDDLDFPFNICGVASIEAGVLKVERGPETQSPCGMFSGGIYGIDVIPPDTTVVVLFKTNWNFNIGVHAGDYSNETIRRFSYGLYQGGTWDFMQGSHYEGWSAPMVRVDSWYYFAIQRASNGDINVKLWERDHPENGFEFHRNLGSEWGTLPLTFVADFVEVPFFVDEIQFLKE